MPSLPIERRIPWLTPPGEGSLCLFCQFYSPLVMPMLPSRREVLQTAAAGMLGAGPLRSALRRIGGRDAAAVEGHLTGAEAVVDTLISEGVMCVYGIPGAQQNELWDTMKSRRLPYLLVTQEFSAAAMA